MSPTYKMIHVVGTSQQSYEDAIQSAVRDAAKSLRNLRWFEIDEMRGRIEQDRVVEYQVKLHISFHVEGD